MLPIQNSVGPEMILQQCDGHQDTEDSRAEAQCLESLDDDPGFTGKATETQQGTIEHLCPLQANLQKCLKFSEEKGSDDEFQNKRRQEQWPQIKPTC